MPAVLVTGANSGIGLACTVELSKRDFRVFAGVRRVVSMDIWADGVIDRIVPVRLDVTDRGEISAATELISDVTGGHGLQGLVNNAGIGVAGPLEFLPMAELRRQLEINLVGQFAVTQAMLPLIRAGDGRIVNMGSESGRLALPLLGPYAASKFALRALNDALRVELSPSGIPVSLIEPATVATPIWPKAIAEADRQVANLPPEAHERYGAMIRTVRARAGQYEQAAIPIEQVVDAVVHALTADRPRSSYLVAPRSRIWLMRLLSVIPARLRDSLILRSLR